MNRDVFLSILAMDAYQRGYSSGINGISGVKIGNATIKHDTSELVEGGTRLDIPAGFYALSYTLNSTCNYGDSLLNP